MFLKKVAALVLMLSFVTAAIGAPPAVSTAKAGMDRERLSLIAPRMKAFVDKGTVPGVVTLIARHGAVASLEAVGYQDLEEKKPISPEVAVRVGKLFGGGAGAWVRMQGAYDTWQAERKVDVSKIPTLKVA